MRFANSRGKDKSNFAAKEFLIVHDRVGYPFSIDLSRQLRRQLKLFQQRNNIIPFPRRKSGTFYRNRAGRRHPNTDAIAMRNFEVGGAFDRVSDRVAKIEERAFSGNLASIFRHNSGFDRDVAPNKRDESVIPNPESFRGRGTLRRYLKAFMAESLDWRSG